MKLNNKGFAFSTMLYGTLALITLILYIILGINKGASDEIYFYGDEIQIKLNECVYEEITLENCYSSHSGGCDATSYHACLGISDSPTEIAGDLVAETLKRDSLTTSGDGLYDDFLTTRRYIFRGNTANNYVKYANKMWRVVSIEPDGSLKLLDYTYNYIANWDTNSQDNWSTSTLKVFLNSNYLASIQDTSKIVSGQWDATLVYPSGGSSGFSIYDYKEQYDSQMASVTSYAQVGILSIYDYMAASTATGCQDSMLRTVGCTSWLSDYKGWTLNIDAEKTPNSAFYFASNSSFYNNEYFVEDATDSAQRVYPIITLDRNSEFIPGGQGTPSNPYVVK